MKELKKNENFSSLNSINIDQEKETESYKNNNIFMFNNMNNSKNAINKKRSLINYEPTKIQFIQNEPLLKPDNFHEIFSQFNNYEINNNINLNNNNNNKIKVIKIKLNINNSKNILNKNSFNFNENSDSNDYNSSKFDQIRLLEDSGELNNRSNIPSNENKQIEIINIHSNFPHEISMNYNNSKNIDDTIKTFEEENENVNSNSNNFNINNNNQNLNEINLENNKFKNNTFFDIDSISDNKQYSPDGYMKANRNSNEMNNNENFFTFNKNKNQNQESSPYQIPSSFNTQKEIINSNININKDNFLSPMTPGISPLFKNSSFNNNSNNNNNNMIQIQNQTNFQNIGNNSIFEKNPFTDLTPFIQQKEQEFFEIYGKSPQIHNTKNYQMKIINNNINIDTNIDPVKNWRKMAEFLRQRNSMNNNRDYIINSIIKKFKNEDIFNNNIFQSKGLNEELKNSVEQSTKIITNTIVKEILPNSTDNIIDHNIDSSEIDNNNYNWNNVKELPQEIEYNYEPTNLSFI